MGEVGVGIYINGGLSTFITNAVDLLDKMHELKTMGYRLEVKHGAVCNH